MESRDNKRKKFQKPVKKTNRAPLIISGIFFVAVLAIMAYQFAGSPGETKTATKSTFQTGSAVTYAKTTQQKDVGNKVEANQVVISLDDVKSNNFVRTFYNQNGKKLPLTAYLTNKGDLVVGVSVCEPCNGESFRIEGDKIICNVCGTTWNLNTLQGISGGCTKYPPDTLTYKVEGSNILIDESLVKNWQRRA